MSLKVSGDVRSLIINKPLPHDGVLPYQIALKVFKMHLWRALVKQGQAPAEALALLIKAKKEHSPLVTQILEGLVKECPNIEMSIGTRRQMLKFETLGPFVVVES